MWHPQHNRIYYVHSYEKKVLLQELHREKLNKSFRNKYYAVFIFCILNFFRISIFVQNSNNLHIKRFYSFCKQIDFII